MIALTQWRNEIEKFTDGSLTICTYHGPDRESQTPRELLKKYDVVLTTYQVVEADFRKMTSPNRVECPNCGGKFKIDKLPIHLKYFCGETAQKTEAQARQRRNSDRDEASRSWRRNRRDKISGKSVGKDKKNADTKESEKQKEKVKNTQQMQNQSKQTKPVLKKATTSVSKPSTMNKQKSQRKADSDFIDQTNTTSLVRPSRNAARKAATQIMKSAAEWIPPDDESGNDDFKPELESSSQDVSETDESSESDSDNSALQRALAKQKQALARARRSKGKKQTLSRLGKKSYAAAKKSDKKTFGQKDKTQFDDGDDNSSSSDDSDHHSETEKSIDMDALVLAAMEGGKRPKCIIVIHKISIQLMFPPFVYTCS